MEHSILYEQSICMLVLLVLLAEYTCMLILLSVLHVEVLVPNEVFQMQWYHTL